MLTKKYRIYLKKEKTNTLANAPYKIRAFLTTKKGKLIVKHYPMNKQVYMCSKIVNLKDFLEQGYIDLQGNDFNYTRTIGAFMWDVYSIGQIEPIYLEQ